MPFLELDGGRRLAELVTFMELHLELVARRLYGQVFWKRPASDEVRQAVEKDLAKGVRAFGALAKFEPYIAGKALTLAD